MSQEFRELLKKVGSGQHTHKDLTRSEAALALKMILFQEATPAQIGAFLIAHRIKRPTGAELAGMLDTYEQIGPKLSPLTDLNIKVVVFGVPYDGRSRTTPVTHLTSLILSAAGVGTVTHGGGIMPTKYGIPLLHIWQDLGLDFTQLSLTQVQDLLEKTNFTFVHTPQYFPETQLLAEYRDQIGKRPPIATLELIWSPYQGKSLLVAGYVHPPTETMIREAFKIKGREDYLLVKGLEGSCDLRLGQTTIAVASSKETETGFQYLKLSPDSYNLGAQDLPFESRDQLLVQTRAILEGKNCPLTPATLWNGGFYLWRAGVCSDLTKGIEEAQKLLQGGKVAEKYQELVDFFPKSQDLGVALNS